VVDTGNGIYRIYNKNVRDAHHGGMGKLTVTQVLEKSSNVGVVKLVYGNYKSQPQKFVNRLYNFGLQEKTGIDIKGEGKPHIPDPKDANWSGISLPWMAYGYGVEMTDIQLLSYYNAIANNGKLMRPYLVKKIKSFDKTIKELSPKVLNSSIASKETVKKMQEMLKGVVLRGTATNIKNPYVSIAGKTGTAQTEYWKGKGQYIASFVGYFPADNPKYSMIVVVHKPNPEKGYYGNIVAAPVFKELAEYIYGKMPREVKLASFKPVVPKKTEAIVEKYKTIMPDLKGLPSKSALYILENMGVKVHLSGSGKVVEQSVPRGVKVHKNQVVELKLI
jgi:cell division protein FtsI (penicillin-binding protein 3)